MFLPRRFQRDSGFRSVQFVRRLVRLADGLFQNNRLNRSQPEVSEALAAWTAESEAFTGSGLNDLFAAQTKA